MTPDETAMVLAWLRRRGAVTDEQAMTGGLFGNGTLIEPERRLLQRALRNGEPISREIRDAMADWLEADPTGLVHRSWLNQPDAISSLMKAKGLTFPEAVELRPPRDTRIS